MSSRLNLFLMFFLFQSAWSFSSLSPGPPSTSSDSAMSTSSRLISLERLTSICSISLVRWQCHQIMWLLYYIVMFRDSLLSLQHPQPSPLHSHERQVQASIQECDALQDQQVNHCSDMFSLLTKLFYFYSSYTAVFTSNRTTLDTQLGTEKSFKIRRISQCQNNNAEINGQRQKITETCFDWEVVTQLSFEA